MLSLRSVLVTGLMFFILITLSFPQVVLGQQQEMVGGHNCSRSEVEVYGSNERVFVKWCMGMETFVYSSPYTESSIFAPYLASQFFYFDENLSVERYVDKPLQGRYVVFDPDLPEGYSPVDLYFDEGLRSDLIDNLSDVISQLIGRVKGFVLGDEWPRGLTGKIIVESLISHNSTFKADTGLWMRENPSSLEKTRMGEWFYAHSVEVWNQIARDLRSRFPDIYLGTNIDLVWSPDLEGDDVAHWSEKGVWDLIDLDPYDFVVTHYFTKIYQEDDDFLEVDESSITGLRDALRSLTGSGLLEGKDLFLMLGAHCTYPYVITPAQMVEEWNAALEYSEYLAGIGWFTYDIWLVKDSLVIRALFDSSAPLSRGRRFTLRELSELNRCGWCTGFCEASIKMETGTFILEEGEEAEIRFSINPGWLEGQLKLGPLSVSLITTNASLHIGDCLVWRNGSMEGCIWDLSPWQPLTLGKSGSLSATIPVRVLEIDNPQSFNATLGLEVKIGRQIPPCQDHILGHSFKIQFTVTPEIPEPTLILSTSLFLLTIILSRKNSLNRKCDIGTSTA